MAKDTYSYKGWMLSDHFLKRAFAVFGHQLVAALIVQAVVLVIFIIFFLPFMLLGAFL